MSAESVHPRQTEQRRAAGGSKRGTAAYVIGAKDLSPAGCCSTRARFALQFVCALDRADGRLPGPVARVQDRRPARPRRVNTLALLIAYGPLVLSFATLILPLGGWLWEQQSGGRSPSERERLVFEDAIATLSHADPGLRPPRRWFVTRRARTQRRGLRRHADAHPRPAGERLPRSRARARARAPQQPATRASPPRCTASRPRHAGAVH